MVTRLVVYTSTGKHGFELWRPVTIADLMQFIGFLGYNGEDYIDHLAVAIS